MNLLKLPSDLREFLVGLNDPKEIRKYSERKIRNLKPDSLAELRDNPILHDLIFCGNDTAEIKV